MSVAALRADAPAQARDFLEALGAGPAGEATPLAASRMQARARFAASGFPTRRLEAWRFTDLKPLIEARFAPAAEAVPADLTEGLTGAVDRLVFVNGRFDAAQSTVGDLPDGVFVGSFADWAHLHPADAQPQVGDGPDHALVALNAAFAVDGPVVVVPDGVALARTVEIQHWNGGTACALRSLIRLGSGAAATILERFTGTGRGWTNGVATVAVGDKARLGRYVVQDESLDTFHTLRLDLTLGAGARHDGFLLTLGGRMARQDVHATLAGFGGTCTYSGAYLLDRRQEATIASVIEHAAPGCSSREVFKGCLGDRAHGVFQGKILVRPDAQKTDGYQLNKTILLGDRAVMDSKPELEIHADDVKCSHGATIGDLDDNAMFYLRSRGIPADTARRILIAAFVLDAVDQVEDETVRAYLVRMVETRLERA